ncbi:MAG: hypothetical protein EKK46_09445 [Rhodocyclaceae bacterium]|nr:MAG: hypothetical protein EKK46_09445 [Rhodocyclaceae bacterium]
MAINQWLNVSNGTRGGTREGGTPPGTPSSTAPTTQGRTGVTVNQLTPNKTTTNSGGGLRQEEIQEYVEAALWLQNQSPKGIGNETKLRQSIATRIKRSGPTERDKEDLATFKRHMDKAQRSKADAHAHAERAEELRRQEIRQREIEEGILGTLIQGGPGIRSLLIEAAIDNAVPIAKKTLIRQRAKFVEQGTVDEMDPIARSFLRQAAATHGNEYKAA